MVRVVWVFASILLAAQAASANCPPAGWSKDKFLALKAATFQIADVPTRERFAEAVVACLASPDPELRDGIAFEALSHMLRQEQLGTEVRLRIARDLLRRLQGADGAGFERPFAALVLAEIVRADRIKAYLPGAMREAIAADALSYVRGVKDYRGFDEREGWRHGVAHGADLLMQMARNPNFAAPDLAAKIRDAAGAQVAPPGHFYIYGESDRLMQPIVVLAQRKAFDAAAWSAWFADLAKPAPLATWGEAYRSQAGLARLHNLRAFLTSVLVTARLSENTDDDVLLAGAEAALREL